MEVSDREKERILDEKIKAIMILLAEIYPPGCKEVINLPGSVRIKKSKYKLTLRSIVVKICKLIDKRIKGESMALIQCPECKKEISDSAPSCPSCGYSIKPKPVEVIVKKKGLGCFGLIGILIIAVIIIVIIDSVSDSVRKANLKPAEKAKVNFSSFIEQHPKMNIAYKVISEQQIDNWKEGERFIVKTTTGVYYFYLKNDKVVTVKEDSPTGKVLYQEK